MFVDKYAARHDIVSERNQLTPDKRCGDRLAEGDTTTVVLTLAVVICSISSFYSGRQSLRDEMDGEVDLQSSAAHPETVRREYEARAAYLQARGERIQQEKAAEERLKQEEAERERQEAAARAEQERQQAAARAEQERQEAIAREEYQRRQAAEQAEQDRINAAVRSAQAQWQSQQPPPPPQIRRTYALTETVQVADPKDLAEAIDRMVRHHSGSFLSRGLVPDAPQVTADGRSATIAFWREDEV